MHGDQEGAWIHLWSIADNNYLIDLHGTYWRGHLTTSFQCHVLFYSWCLPPWREKGVHTFIYLPELAVVGYQFCCGRRRTKHLYKTNHQAVFMSHLITHLPLFISLNSPPTTFMEWRGYSQRKIGLLLCDGHYQDCVYMWWDLLSPLKGFMVCGVCGWASLTDGQLKLGSKQH